MVRDGTLGGGEYTWLLAGKNILYILVLGITVLGGRAEFGGRLPVGAFPGLLSICSCCAHCLKGRMGVLCWRLSHA